ncbi:MBL fold metallo-hydrolase [Polaromonas jejuensis]|uniref:MBL fold metallo-hydrolase n=1 Tax=Polaromonas jejuensis TaxID=457502 RepID=A0ABW0Q438_9BURK|nr:MBL fold metallo-hydrolase [Polaromonas jejuensis]
MLRFKSLGSGSSGNATLVEAAGGAPFRLLVDCGLGIKHLTYRLGEAGLQPEDIDAVFITHEHGDHIGCARSLSLRHRIPVWMSHGTHAAMGSPDFDGLLRTARDGEAIDLGGLQLTPFSVPHDAREPLQLSCTDGSAKLGILTDLGHATAHVLAHLQACDAMLLECNHDADMLARSAYPAFLKRRVGGPYGHLSNSAAADIARALVHQGLKHLVAAHLSAQNNQPALVQALIAEALSCGPEDIMVAKPDVGTGWLQL